MKTKNNNYFDLPKVASIAKHSSSMSTSGPRNQSRNFSASLRLFFPKVQRGVSGMANIRTTSRAGEIAPMRASHFQWHTTPITYDNRRPAVTANWLTEPSIPRNLAGEISAMYTWTSKQIKKLIQVRTHCRLKIIKSYNNNQPKFYLFGFYCSKDNYPKNTGIGCTFPKKALH